MKTICRETDRYYLLIHAFYEPFFNHKRLHILYKQICRMLVCLIKYTLTIQIDTVSVF